MVEILLTKFLSIGINFDSNFTSYLDFDFNDMSGVATDGTNGLRDSEFPEQSLNQVVEKKVYNVLMA